MKFGSRKALIVLGDDRFELRLIAREILRGIRWIHRILNLDRAVSHSALLGDHLKGMSPPRKLLLIAHGKNGRFWFKPDPTAQDEALPHKWWDIHDDNLSVYALGCSSVECFSEYNLVDRVGSYLGYKDEISFFVGTRRGRRIVRDLLSRIGARFMKTSSIDETFRSELSDAYEAVMDKVSARYNAKKGDRLSLLFLEEQLQGLELMRR